MEPEMLAMRHVAAIISPDVLDRLQPRASKETQFKHFLKFSMHCWHQAALRIFATLSTIGL